MVSKPTFEHFDRELADKMTGRRSKHGIDSYLGIEVTSFEEGRCVAEFEVRDELITMIGNLHGGCLAALTDHVLGVVMYPHMQKGYWAATTEWKINYLAPVSEGTCIATADIISMTRRTSVVTITIENAGRIAAVAQGTCLIVAPKPKP